MKYAELCARVPRLGSFFSFRGPLTSSNEQARAGKDECLLIIVYLRSINFGIGGHCFPLPPFSPQLSKLFYLSCVSTFQKQKFKQKFFHIFLFTHLSLCLFDSLNCAPWVGFVGRGKLALTYYKLHDARVKFCTILCRDHVRAGATGASAPAKI